MKIRPTTGKKRENQLAIKIGDEELKILNIASELCEMSESHFVMNCALKRACEIVIAADEDRHHNNIVSKIQPLIIEDYTK